MIIDFKELIRKLSETVTESDIFKVIAFIKHPVAGLSKSVTDNYGFKLFAAVKKMVSERLNIIRNYKLRGSYILKCLLTDYFHP